MAIYWTLLLTATYVLAVPGQTIPSTDANCFAFCLAKCLHTAAQASKSPSNITETCGKKCAPYSRPVKELCANRTTDDARELCKVQCVDLGTGQGVSARLRTEDFLIELENATRDYPELRLGSGIDRNIYALLIEVEGAIDGKKFDIVMATRDFPRRFDRPKHCQRYTFRVAPVTPTGIGAYNDNLFSLNLKPVQMPEGASIEILNMTFADPESNRSDVVVHFRVPTPIGFNASQLTYDILNAPRECERPNGQGMSLGKMERFDADTYNMTVNRGYMERSCQFTLIVSSITDTVCHTTTDVLLAKTILINCNYVEDAPCDRGERVLRPTCGPLLWLNWNISYTILSGEPEWSDRHVYADYANQYALTNNLTIALQIDTVDTSHLKNPVLYYMVRYGFGNITTEAFIKVGTITELLGYIRTCKNDMRSDPTTLDIDNVSRIPSKRSLDTCTNDTSELALEIRGIPYGVIVMDICAVHDPRWEMLQYTTDADKQRLLSGMTGIDVQPTVQPPKPSKTSMIVTAVIVPVVLIAILATLAILLIQRRAVTNQKKMLDEIETNKRTLNEYVENQQKLDKREISRERLIIDKDNKLGSGAFGNVYMGKLLGRAETAKEDQSILASMLMRFENCPVAIKMLPDSADPYSKSAFLQEIDLMKSLGWHDNLVNILACVTVNEPYCLVMECCTDGNLLTYLRERTKYMMKLDEHGIRYWEPEETQSFDTHMILTLKQVLSFALQVSYGMEYLHAKGYVHRDLAARNVLVHEKVTKVADFGLCRKIDENSSAYMTKGGRLPLKWMSLESLRSNEFTFASDVWSYGVLLFELISFGGEPYPNINPQMVQKYLEDGNRLSAPEHCDEDIYNIMQSCWLTNAMKRPSFPDIRETIARKLETVTQDTYNYLDPSQDYYQPIHKQDEYDDAKRAPTRAEYPATEQPAPRFLRPSHDTNAYSSTDTRITNASASPSSTTPRSPNQFFLPTVSPHVDRPLTAGTMQSAAFVSHSKQLPPASAGHNESTNLGQHTYANEVVVREHDDGDYLQPDNVSTTLNGYINA